LELAWYLPVESCAIQEIVIVLKRRSKRHARKAWYEDPDIETLAGVAEPLNARGSRTRHARAYQRDAEVGDLAARLHAKRGSVLLVGEPGVGKTTILAEAARRMERDARNTKDHETRGLWITNAHRIIAGMRFLGQWQARCEKLIRELSNVGGILCVESLLDLIRTGGEGPLDSIAAFLAPFLARGDLTVVAEASPSELDVCRRLLPGFADLFQILPVPAFSERDAKIVLHNVAEAASRNLHLDVEAGIPEATYRLFSRFSPYAAFPGPAVDFLADCFETAKEGHVSALTARGSGRP